MKESNLAKSWLPEWQKKNPDSRLFRNNTGCAWLGEVEAKKQTSPGKWLVKLHDAIFVKFGIGIKNKKGHPSGGGDYVGWTEKNICEEMCCSCNAFSFDQENDSYVCGRFDKDIDIDYLACEKYYPRKIKKIAVFTNIEFKTKGIRESKDQKKFREMVIESGGIAKVIKEDKNEK